MYTGVRIEWIEVWIRTLACQVRCQNRRAIELVYFKNGEGAKSETTCGCMHLWSPGFPPTSLAC